MIVHVKDKLGSPARAICSETIHPLDKLITIQQISVKKAYCASHWMPIYLLKSVVHPWNNWGLKWSVAGGKCQLRTVQQMSTQNKQYTTVVSNYQHITKKLFMTSANRNGTVRIHRMRPSTELTNDCLRASHKSYSQ